MGFEEIVLERSEGIATITFNRPEAMNAITPAMLKETRKALDEARTDDSTGVIVLTGAGRAFSAGVDLKALNNLKLEGGAVSSEIDDLARKLIQAIQKSRQVIIAKINGFCYTSALEIALACDLIYAAEDARLGDTHAKWGLRPTWGMSARLPMAVGLLRARELSFTARDFTGAEAAAWDLANRAVPAAELDGLVESVARQILENSAESIAAYKTLYNKGGGRVLKKSLKYEEEAVFDISDTTERLAGFLRRD